MLSTHLCIFEVSDKTEDEVKAIRKVLNHHDGQKCEKDIHVRELAGAVVQQS